MSATMSGGDAYHAQRLTNDTWSKASPSKRQQSIVSAIDFLSNHFRSQIIPDPAVYEQACYMMTQEYQDAINNRSGVSVDDISVSYGSTRSAPRGISPMAWKLITADGRFGLKWGRII